MKEKLEEGLFWVFEIIIEFISIDVSLPKVKILEPWLHDGHE